MGAIDVVTLFFEFMHVVRGLDIPACDKVLVFRATVRKRNQSHPLARDDGAVNNDGHKRRTQTGFITVEKTLKIPLYQRV